MRCTLSSTLLLSSPEVSLFSHVHLSLLKVLIIVVIGVNVSWLVRALPLLGGNAGEAISAAGPGFEGAELNCGFQILSCTGSGSLWRIVL